MSERSGYVGHIDERRIFEAAQNVLHGPDLNPGFFDYPSLPIYLTAASIHASNLVFGEDGDAGQVIRYPAPAGAPYSPERPIRHARMLFAILGAIVFLWVALLSRELSGSYAWAWLAPVGLRLSALMQQQVIDYHNVDPPTAFFAMATLLVVMMGWRSHSLLLKAVAPGLLCGHHKLLRPAGRDRSLDSANGPSHAERDCLATIARGYAGSGSARCDAARARPSALRNTPRVYE